MTAGFIYFVRAGDSGPIKVGFTRRSPHLRLAKMQTDCPYVLTLLGAIEGTPEGEREFHSRFADHRRTGEWFSPADRLLDAITELLANGRPWVETSSLPRHDHPLAAYRASNNLSLAELGMMVCASRAHIARIECRKREPSLSLLGRICELTKIRPAELKPSWAHVFAMIEVRQ